MQYLDKGFCLLVFLIMIHRKEAENQHFINVESRKSVHLLNYQKLKFKCVHFVHKYATRDALVKFDGEAIRVK